MLRSSGAFVTPPVVKNLVIINALFFMAQTILPYGLGRTLTEYLGLHFWESESFRAYQFITHMFLHGDFSHLLMNMFALWMFGRSLEYDLGSKRFLTYYMITGIGASLIHQGVNFLEIESFTKQVAEAGFPPQLTSILQLMINRVTIGASGAVFGVLLAFGMLHPNTMIMLLIPPIPIRAKYFVIGYGALELILGLADSGSNIAHFAHVGGMIFGYLLLRWWKNKNIIYY